jgi:hypothetical protein
MHRLFHNRLGKAFPNGGLKVRLSPKGSAQNRLAAQLCNHGAEFAYHSDAYFSAKCRRAVENGWETHFSCSKYESLLEYQ